MWFIFLLSEEGFLEVHVPARGHHITGRDWEVPLLRGRIGGINLDEFGEMINWRIILYEIIFTQSLLGLSNKPFKCPGIVF